MSQRYAQVKRRFWLGRTGRKLRTNPHAQILAFYLMTAPESNAIGLYYLPVEDAALHTGLDPDDVRKALAVLQDDGFCMYDSVEEVVWVCAMAREQIGSTLKPKDKRRPGVLRDFQDVRSDTLRVAFAERYPTFVAENEAPCKPLISPFQGGNKPPVVAVVVDKEKEETRATLGQQLLEQGGPNFSAEELLGVRTQLMREGWSEGFQLRLGRAPTAPLHPHVAQQLAQGPWSKMELAFSVANWIHKGDPEQRRDPFDFLRESEHWYRLGCIALERHEAKQAGGGA